VLPLIICLFMSYALFGPVFPGILQHPGVKFKTFVSSMYFPQEGIFGVTLWVASTIVFNFVLFGVIAPRTGLGQLFIDNATILAGRYTGVQAKVSVVSSAFCGTISGSSVANTVSKGALTIPNMKRLGYPGHFAGGVAAAAFVYAQVLLFVSEPGFDLWEFSYAATSCIVGVIPLSAAVVGYWLAPMGALSRWLPAISGLIFIAPSLQADLLAAIIASPVARSQIIARRHLAPTAGEAYAGPGQVPRHRHRPHGERGAPCRSGRTRPCRTHRPTPPRHPRAASARGLSRPDDRATTLLKRSPPPRSATA
jgi:TRAP-type uncharacterized transport system fused permease subunit